MGKLHELLAVESALASEARSVMAATVKLFKEGSGRLTGQARRYEPIEEDGESLSDENVLVATTVDKELSRMLKTYGRWMDASFQKEKTNQDTSSDLIIGDVVAVYALPATALLNLEGKLVELKKIFGSIPTLDPTETWTYDDQLEVWVAASRLTYRTQKRPKVLVKYVATPEHPAQTEVYMEDVRVGHWVTTIQSGAIPLRVKRGYIERIDNLIRAVKRARQKANDIEASNASISDSIFAYILGE